MCLDPADPTPPLATGTATRAATGTGDGFDRLKPIRWKLSLEKKNGLGAGNPHQNSYINFYWTLKTVTAARLLNPTGCGRIL